MNSFRIFLFAILIVCSKNSLAQSIKSDSLFLPDKMRQFQFFLDDDVISIENLRYELSNEPIPFHFNKETKQVIMEHYKKGSRVVYDAIKSNNVRVSLKKSSCFIDPVVYSL